MNPGDNAIDNKLPPGNAASVDSLVSKMLQQAIVKEVFKGSDSTFPATLWDPTSILGNQNRNRLKGLQASCANSLNLKCHFISLWFGFHG